MARRAKQAGKGGLSELAETVRDKVSGETAEASAAPHAQTPRPATRAEEVIKRRQVNVPLTVDRPPTEFPVHIDVRLDVAQSTALRRVARALDLADAHLKNGTRVVHPTQALRYLLEQLDAA